MSWQRLPATEEKLMLHKWDLLPLLHRWQGEAYVFPWDLSPKRGRLSTTPREDNKGLCHGEQQRGKHHLHHGTAGCSGRGHSTRPSHPGLALKSSQGRLKSRPLQSSHPCCAWLLPGAAEVCSSQREPPVSLPPACTSTRAGAEGTKLCSH